MLPSGPASHPRLLRANSRCGMMQPQRVTHPMSRLHDALLKLTGVSLARCHRQGAARAPGRRAMSALRAPFVHKLSIRSSTQGTTKCRAAFLLPFQSPSRPPLGCCAMHAACPRRCHCRCGAPSDVLTSQWGFAGARPWAVLGAHSSSIIHTDSAHRALHAQRSAVHTPCAHAHTLNGALHTTASHHSLRHTHARTHACRRPRTPHAVVPAPKTHRACYKHKYREAHIACAAGDVG